VRDKIPSSSPSPNLFRRNFLLHLHPYEEKFSFFGSPNRIISVRIPFTDEIDIPTSNKWSLVLSFVSIMPFEEE
jgi:hypothetical protein